FHAFTPLTLQLASAIPARPTSIGIHGGLLLGRFVGPHGFVFSVRFGNVRANNSLFGERRNRLRGVIALVGHYVLDFLLAARLAKIGLGLVDAIFQSRRVVLVGMVHLGGQNHFGIQVDHVLGLVGQVCRAVFHAGDASVRVGFAHPLFIGDLLVFPLFIEF